MCSPRLAEGAPIIMRCTNYIHCLVNCGYDAMLTRAQMNVNSSWSVARVYSGGSGILRTTCRVYSGMSTDLSARSRVEAMLDKLEAAERGPGQAPPPALGRRRQQQGGTRGRSAHLKRPPPPGGRRQHYGGRAAAAAPYSLESVGSCNQVVHCCY